MFTEFPAYPVEDQAKAQETDPKIQELILGKDRLWVGINPVQSGHRDDRWGAHRTGRRRGRG